MHALVVFVLIVRSSFVNDLGDILAAFLHSLMAALVNAAEMEDIRLSAEPICRGVLDFFRVLDLDRYGILFREENREENSNRVNYNIDIVACLFLITILEYNVHLSLY